MIYTCRKDRKRLYRWGGYFSYDDKLKAYLCVCIDNSATASFL